MSHPKSPPPDNPYAAAKQTHPTGAKRFHQSPFFWVGAFFILLAMVIFVTTDYFSFLPGKKNPPTALTPP